MDLQWQPNLFAGHGEVTVDTDFRVGQRTSLDAGSWVEVFPGWLSGANALFARLAEAVPWQEHFRWLFRQRFLEPRLTAEYRRLADVPHPALTAAAEALSRHYGVRYDNLWLNLYRSGADSTGWHRDRFSCRRPECIVPVLTLGATRRFLIKPRAGGESVAFRPSAGDLVVMGGRCQDEWVHSVPKAPGTLGARISINFQSSEQAQRAAAVNPREVKPLGE
jgi:alkylated DNA repair dioxygenase AlkB